MKTNDINTEATSVRIKGVGDALWVTLDPSQPLEILQQEIGRRFDQMQQLAVNARVVIDAGNARQGQDLLHHLETYLKETFKVGRVTGPPQERQRVDASHRIRKRDMDRSWQGHRSDVLMLTGRVRSGQKVTARKHLLIMGDVNPGAEVIAGGDVIVMGSLCGTALAGQPANEDAIVLALDFRPTQIQIGGHVAAGHPDSPGKTIEFAHLENGVILVEDYLSANPFSRLPWPQVR